MITTRLNDLAATLSGDVLIDEGDTAKYLTDWRGKWRGQAIGVARPKSTNDVAAVMNWCAETKTPLVPQGGNTGLSGAATPDDSATSLVISLEKMNTVLSVDQSAGVITAQAGCTLLQLQEAAAEHGLLFPLSLASEGTCQLGGALATNAGGIHVLRYGSARALCLGIEAIFPNGARLDGPKTLFKDNTGYDLKQLLIGSEGTLGVITAASMRLFPRPSGSAVVFAACPTVDNAISAFRLARDLLGPMLTAFELISAPCLEAVTTHMPDARFPLSDHAPFYLLAELSSWRDDDDAQDSGEQWFTAAFERDLISDAIISQSLTQFNDLWALRESVSEAQSHQRPVIKHDVSLPLERIAPFMTRCQKALSEQFTGLSIEPFGHMGDGNIHYNIGPAPDADHDRFRLMEADINRCVHDLVAEAGGSISAEHGLGVLRRDEAARYKSADEQLLMRAIKSAIDPNQLMNPGKVLTMST